MREILLFVEDDAQEHFLAALVKRIATECGTRAHVGVRSATGGWPRVLDELERFGTRCAAQRDSLPDIVVVGIDANCQGAKTRRALIQERCTEALWTRVVPAVPDPHVERWYLLDGKAFKDVIGRGCDAPGHKCEKDRYKQLLANAIRAAGRDPLLGGIEYAEDLASAIDLHRAARIDAEFKAFVDEATRRLK